MLSEMRRNLLKKNKDRILAVQIINNFGGVDQLPEDVQPSACLYQYPDGSICAASACLTDAERSVIAASTCNSRIFTEANQQFKLGVDGEEFKSISELQRLHDNFMSGHAPRKYFATVFQELLNELLQEPEEQTNS